jgi:hypothetical protein
MNIEESFSWRKFFRGFISIKLLVWVVATVAFFRGHLSDTLWIVISTGFMGMNVAQDYVRRNGK